jgi:diamine N-acetyltransferase
MLKGENIVLRGVDLSDLQLIEKLENNPDNWLHSGTLIPFSKKSIEEYVLGIQDLANDKQYRWIIDLASKNVSIGAIDLFEYDAVNRRAGIGIILEEKYRKNGFATEAIDLLATYAFSFLNLNQLWATILAFNVPSQRLFENNGFKKMAVKKNWNLYNNEWHDEYFYQRFNPKTI